MKYFDPAKKQLVCIGNKATPQFWDEHWKIDGNIREKFIGIKDTFASRITKKYLKPQDGVILEGGCGSGINVVTLVNNGYKCIGIDYAKDTVGILNRYMPELDIRFGDVRKLPFLDHAFIGYWSWGGS